MNCSKSKHVPQHKRKPTIMKAAFNIERSRLSCVEANQRSCSSQACLWQRWKRIANKRPVRLSSSAHQQKATIGYCYICYSITVNRPHIGTLCAPCSGQPPRWVHSLRCEGTSKWSGERRLASATKQVSMSYVWCTWTWIRCDISVHNARIACKNRLPSKASNSSRSHTCENYAAQTFRQYIYIYDIWWTYIWYIICFIYMYNIVWYMICVCDIFDMRRAVYSSAMMNQRIARLFVWTAAVQKVKVHML